MSVSSLARLGVAGLLCLACVFLFQLSYSVGPVFLARVVADGSSRDQVVAAVLVFLILYFVPYPLTFAASCLQVLWKTKARQAFYNLALSRSFGRVAHAVRAKSQKDFAGLISATGQDIVSDCVDFIYGTASLVFSSTISVVLISAFVFRDFFLSYLVSAVLCWLVVHFLGDWQTRRSEVAEEGYNRFVSALPSAWIPNSLGEGSIVSRFLSVFHRRWRVYRRLTLSAIVAFQSVAMLQAACIWLPTSILFIYQMRSMDIEQIVALAIVLPRLTETMLDVSNLVSNVADYLGLKGRVAWLDKTLADEPIELLDHVNASQIRLLKKTGVGWEPIDLASADALIARGGQVGRYVLLGANGSGKTSFLLHLRSLNPASSFYFPAVGRLFPELGQERSTGQTKIHELEMALRLVEGDGRALLLDEWDANLDPKNRDRISARLDELSRSHVVVEVTHTNRLIDCGEPNSLRT
jgi:hypothetical protein